MRIKNGRLDVPGFSGGASTDPGSIDLAKLFGGRPQRRKSGKPHNTQELMAGRVVSRARKALILTTKLSKNDYNHGKRLRYREKTKAITHAADIKPCIRRFLEIQGKRTHGISYVWQPELIISKAQIAYEVMWLPEDSATYDLQPLMSTTSAIEASVIVASLARYGIEAQFNQTLIPRI